MIKQYRKKPVMIEAIQYDGTEKSVCEILTFTRGNNNAHFITVECGDLMIPTLGGKMRASRGDYIIKEPFGKIRGFYPCKPDIFKKTYEEV